MYGLVGQPLSREAVRQIHDLEEDVRSAEAEVGAARLNNDVEALNELGSSKRLAMLTDPSLSGQVVEALTGLARYTDAQAALTTARDRFPKSIRLMQLEALLARRQNDWRQATRILGKLYELGHKDPETLGIYGAAYKVRAKDEPDQRGQHLRLARQFYQEAYLGDPTSHYAAVNAAGLNIALGDIERAKELATDIIALLDTDPLPDKWASASLGDAKLILGRIDEAEQHYREYAIAVGFAEGDIVTTEDQIVSYLAPGLGLDDQVVEEVRQALGHTST